MPSSSKRRNPAAQRQARGRLVAVGLVAGGLVVAAGAGMLIWNASRPGLGISVPVVSRAHIQEGTDPGAYTSDPPSSGSHYPTDASAGFYDDTAAKALGQYPQGYLVHSLEHGYVIFWYNCRLLDAAACDALTGQIQQVMQQAGQVKLIAFPWTRTDVPVAMTSWGRLLRMPTFDAGQAIRFIHAYRYHAPEPDAP